MNEHQLRVRVGIFFAMALIGLAVLIVWFGGLPTPFTRYNRYIIIFTDAPGVDRGTPVRKSGIRIGQVRRIELDDETGQVKVYVDIDRKYTVRQNEDPVLNFGLLGGDATIDFVPRPPGDQPPDRTPVPPGSELVGVSRADVNAFLNQAAEMVPTTRETLNEIRKSVQRIDKMGPLMEETLKEYRDLARASREAIPDLRKTNQQVQDLANASREAIPSLRRTTEEIEITARNWGRVGERLNVLIQSEQDKVIKALENLNDTILRFGSIFSDENRNNLTVTLKNVRDASTNLEGLTKSTDDLMRQSRETMRQVSESVKKAEGVLNNLSDATRPLADRGQTVMKNLDESSEKLNQTLTDVRQLLRVMTQEGSLLYQLALDPALYNNVNEGVCMVLRILPRIERAVADFEVFADKIARHPESLGVGGVIRPSSGLKLPPTNGPIIHRPGE